MYVAVVVNYQYMTCISHYMRYSIQARSTDVGLLLHLPSRLRLEDVTVAFKILNLM